MLNRRFIVVAACVVGALALQIAPASSHQFIPFKDSEDNGEIRWNESTRYDVEVGHANYVWEILDRVDIAKDDFWSVEDLEWFDETRCDVAWAGSWSWDPAFADEIYLSVCNFDAYGYDLFARQGTAAHEMGHAHGLDHSYLGQLMNSCSRCSGVNAPQDHDRADYYERWQ